MKKIILLLLLMPFPLVWGQFINAEKKILSVFSADTFIGYDKFGARYGIRDNVFFKSADGISAEYRNLSLGRISRVDLQNPLSILLFYEDFNTVVTLDNQLNEIRAINFSENNPPIVAAAAGMAAQNRFWIYEAVSQQIGLYDYLNNKHTVLTQPLRGDMLHYESDFNYFYWIDEQYNWYACDMFGKISFQGTVPEYDHIIIAGIQLLFYTKDGTIYVRDLKNGKTYEIRNVEKSFNSFNYTDQILSIFTKDGITNYKITIP